ncbi:MAG: putative ABC transporter permease [Oscillospiraceae bacterium]|nr:putative ABC transporter permease [Oscillospiraceae bacterium]
MRAAKRIREDIMLFLFGGILYSLIEICFRGFTHWTMTVTGGLCFMIIYRHYEGNPNESMLSKCLYGMFVITAFEFAVGCAVNLMFRWNVWDYSALPFNLFGQVCLLFSALWFLLSVPIVWLCAVFRKKFALAAKF